MQISITELDPKLVAGPAYQGEAKPQRSAGLHLSQIYHDIEETLTPREPMEQTQLEAYRAMGFVWEHIVANGLKHALMTDSLIAPGEYTMEGVIGSPDLLDVENDNSDLWVVVDTKATYKSVRKLDNLEKYFWSWLMQLKGYCRMVGTQHARLDIVFICGDWKPPAPQFKRVTLEFSKREIEDNWNMLMSHARKRGWVK